MSKKTNLSKSKTKSKGAAILADVKRRERNRMILIQVAVGAVLVALIAGIGITLTLKKRDKDEAENRVPVVNAAQVPGATPEVKLDISRTDQDGIKVAKPGTKVSIIAYEDFQCPGCQALEARFGPTLAELAASGAASVEYRPIAILDRMSSTDYSSRATNAAWCVAEADITKWPATHKNFFEQQPPEQSAGLSDSQLTEIAKAAGAPESVKSCIESGKFRGYVKKSTERNLVQTTPTVLLNGRKLENELESPATLKAAVAAAAPK